MQAVPCGARGTGYKGPYLVSYLDTMVLHLPTSLRSSATSVRRAVFSFSRKAARMVIWFSFRRLASRERLAATLFFLRLVQYFSSCGKVPSVGDLVFPLREPNLPTPRSTTPTVQCCGKKELWTLPCLQRGRLQRVSRVCLDRQYAAVCSTLPSFRHTG